MRGRKVKYRYQDIVHQIEQLALIKLNWTKISQVLGVNIRTIDRYKKLHPELSQAYEEGKTRGETSLKGKAFSMAMAGDTVMLKHCLRNITDWQEKDSEFNVNNTTNVYPQRTLIFKDIKNADDGRTADLHASEGAGSNRVESKV